MTTTYKIVYWPGFLGRSEVAILLLEDAKATYTVDNDVQGFLTSQASSSFRPFACPVLVKESGDDPFVLSQTPIIAAYLGKELGYFPSTPTDEIRALQLAINTSDLAAEVLTAAKAVPEQKTTLLEQGRLGNWLDVVETFFTKDGSFIFGGNQPTYVDFLVLSVINSVKAIYGGASRQLLEAHPRTSALVETLRARPNIKAYYESERALPKFPARLTATA